MTGVSSLFRAEALKAGSTRAAGDIVLATPIATRVLGALALVVAVSIGAFLALGTYTRHVTVAGQVVADRGVVAVLAPQAGTLVRRRVEEGSRVEHGDELFAVSGERRSAAFGETHAHIAGKLAVRRRNLLAQIEETHLLEAADRRALAQHAQALEAERARLERTIETQAARVALAEDTMRRYTEMRAAGFVSQEQLAARHEALLDQRARSSALEGEIAQLSRQLAELGSERESLTLRYRREVAELERAVTSNELEAAENEARRELTVIAPIAGIATAISGSEGQIVDAGTPLASIVPHDARWLAELSSPSHAMGFIAEGAEVLLRYSAYPYQQFGHHPGRVISVSRAALPAGAGMSSTEPGREPVYKVVVEMASQTVDVYGEARPLRAGMQVEADVKLETRRLYEWVLEPLYAMKMRASGGREP